jgi:hypothetical protein
MSKEIQVVGSDRNAIVDDEDFDWARKYEWFLDENGYVVRARQLGEEGLADDDEVIEMGTEVYSRRNGEPLSKFMRPKKKNEEMTPNNTTKPSRPLRTDESGAA